MNAQRVRKIGKGRFLVHWANVKDSQLILDFNPLIDAYGLINDFVIVHWQAKPIFFRKWGAYDSNSDSYFCFSANLFSFGNISGSSQRLIEIPEKTCLTKPTACILFENATLQQVNNIFTIIASTISI